MHRVKTAGKLHMTMVGEVKLKKPDQQSQF